MHKIEFSVYEGLYFLVLSNWPCETSLARKDHDFFLVKPFSDKKKTVTNRLEDSADLKFHNPSFQQLLLL
jgi:hypothetical protein